MIRVSLLQFRVSFLALAGVLLAVVGLAGATGPSLAHLYDSTIGTCNAHSSDCSAAVALFNSHDQLLRLIMEIVPLSLPALLGMFWGAPLVAKELENGTYKLAWTQGRSRLSWLGAKLIVVGTAAVFAQALVVAVVAAWWRPVERANADRFSPLLFGAFGVASVGYAAFALALGVTAGLLFRHALPAMAATLATYGGARIAFTYWVRPYLAAPTHATVPISASGSVGFDSVARGQMSLTFFPPTIRDAWLRSAEVTDAAGQKPSGAVLNQQCPQLAQAQVGRGDLATALHSCVAHLSTTFHQTLVYHPASHYWPFQWAELAAFLLLAAALAAASAWWMCRRLT